MIPLSVPSLTGNEWEYVKECLDTEWVSSAGKFVDLFEEKMTEYTGAKHAIACVNGTSALQVSLQLVGVKPDDEVITPTLTFIATINAIHYNGASPLFMDADDYYNIDSQKTIEFIQSETTFRDGFTFNNKTGRRISAIVPVHVWGNAVWLDELVDLCNDRNIAIVEDASESLGTFYSKGNFKGKHTGLIGRIGCISFNGNKIITTGGGGMILTDDMELADQARYFTTQAKDDSLRYIHNDIGYNFRLTNIQAALGVAQLENLSVVINKKNEINKQYKAGINKVGGLRISESPVYADNNHWLNILQIDKEIFGADVDLTMSMLREKKIETRPVWHLNHLQQPYKKCQNYRIENALLLLEKSLCIPSSSNLSLGDLHEVISNLHG
jgi:perosamine synthetase